MTRKFYILLLLSIICTFLGASAFAQKAGSGSDQIATFASPIQDLPTEGDLFGLPTNVHGQTTYINQRYNNFTSSYSGMNSLAAQKSMSYTWSGTLFFGARLAPNTDVYFNPEVISGVAFSGLTGLGGFTNGEATKATGAQAKFYSARAFVRHIINQEGNQEVLENEANQITQTVSSNRVVVTAGQFSTLDIFDDSRYAKDPRVQFMNWGNMTYLAYDYAADARGYSTGLAGEWYLEHWVMRASRMLAPKSPNGRDLNWQIFNTYGDQFEIERRHHIRAESGAITPVVKQWSNSGQTVVKRWSNSGQTGSTGLNQAPPADRSDDWSDRSPGRRGRRGGSCRRAT